MTAMRSDIVIASSWSWVTKMNVIPTSCWIRFSSICICLRSFRSRAPSGSSSSSTDGSVDERPGERDALRLAARQLGRLAPLVAGQLDELEHVGDPGPDLGVVDLRAAQAEGDVLVDRQVREERVVLEDRVDVALVGRQPGDVLALQLDQARGRRLEAADHPQGRGLAAARRAKEREEFPGLDLEVDVVDDDGLAVALDDIDEPDVDGGHVRSHSSVGRCAATPPRTRMRPRIWARGRAGVKEREPSRRRRDNACEIRTCRRTDAAMKSVDASDGRGRPQRGRPRRRGTISTHHRQKPPLEPTSKGPDRRCPA